MQVSRVHLWVQLLLTFTLNSFCVVYTNICNARLGCRKYKKK